MECNCNNNNNGGVIPWVRGNRLPLCICIYQMNVDQGTVSTMAYNTMTRTPYVIQADDTVTVTMKSGFRSVEMPFTTDGNKVLVIDNGELPTGTYTVEVTIERGSGERGRWQESRQVRIYENTDEAILGEMYSIEADLFFWAKGDTGVGIANITSNPDDTMTITMTDGTTYTTQAMKGDKGDKGDRGEKGTSIVSFDVTGQTETSVIYTVTFSDDTTEEVAVPKGPQGDTGLTGNGISSTTLNSDYTLTIAYTDGTTYTTSSIRGAQGVQGVSIIAFTQTGETSTNTLYNVVFSDGRTQSVAIPKGLKGDKGDTGNTGSQGSQGPKGDTVTATDYTLYNVQGSSSEGAMSQDATTKAISAQTGYYTCGAAADKVDKVAAVENGNLYKRTLGGHFKVKMTNANTASGVTLQVGSETATTLWYNGAAASADNSWEEGEVISVFYDGTYYQASNAQGGGGKAEKIKYDNSASGLASENVQGALDEISAVILIKNEMNLASATEVNNKTIGTSSPYKWDTASGRKSILLPILPYKTYRIKSDESSPTSFRIAVLRSSVTTGNAAFATGFENSLPLIGIGEAYQFESSSNGYYLYVNTITSVGEAVFDVHEITKVKDVSTANADNIVKLTKESYGSGDTYILNPLLWEEGAISSSDGVDTYSITRVRTAEIHRASDDFYITPSEGYKLYVIYYDESDNFIGADGWKTTEVKIIGGCYYRLIFAKTDDSAITTDILDGNITITNGYASERIASLHKDALSLNSWGGNLFAPTSISGSDYITLTRDDNNVTLTVNSTRNSDLVARICVFNKLQNGGRYKLSMSYELGSVVTIAARNSSNTALEIFTPKASGSGEVNCEFTYVSGMSYLGFIVGSGTPSGTSYVFSDIEFYEVANDNASNTDVINMDSVPDMWGSIDAENIWVLNNASKFALIDVSNHMGGQAIISTPARSVIAFLKTDSHPHNTTAIYATGGERRYVDSVSNSGVYIPNDARFLYVSSVSQAQEDVRPTAVTLVGGHSKCETLTESQIVTRKRSNILNNLKWTAQKSIASGYTQAGDKVGMLYSSCVEVDRYVMVDISLKTFMTAANNPYSLLYTEDLQNNISGYGFTYYNHMSTVRAWMGTVCSRFVFSCIGYDDWDTIHFAWLCRQGILQKSKSQASKDVEVGDIIWIKGHTRLIYDVVNKGRQDMRIVVSEGTMTTVRSTRYSPTSLDSYMSTNHGIFYKFAGERNLIYEPSEFINNYDEPFPEEYVYNNDICTYAGDYAAFRVGYPVWLNYNLKEVGSWNKIQLYKENWTAANVMSLTLVGEYTIDTSINRLQIPASDIAGYGKYRARMSDGTNNSGYTFFEVIDTTVSYSTPDENNPNIKKVTFSSANAGYVKVVFCDRAGTPMAIRPLSIEDKINREIIIDPVTTCRAQRGEALDKTNTYLKVYFKGDYGRVTNEYIKVEF